MSKEKNIPTLEEFILASIDKSFGIYLANLNNCKEHFTEVNVHDARVSMRRFIALISMLEEMSENKYLKLIRRILKKQVNIFNVLRDNQVQILKINKLTYEFPVLYSYYNFLLLNEKNYIITLQNKINRLSHDDVEGFSFFLRLEIKRGLLAKTSGIRELFDIAARAYAGVFELYNAADVLDLSSIHKVRLAFKKYRYMIEILQPIGTIKKRDIGKLKAFQTIMGNIQDLRVLKGELYKFIGNQQEISRETFTPPLAAIDKELEELVGKFFGGAELLAACRLVGDE